MPTQNELIRDTLIRHQVALLRYSGGLHSRILALLNRTEPDLTERILGRLNTQRARAFDSGPVTTARLRALRDFLASLADTVEVSQRGTFDKIDLLVRDEMLGLAAAEVSFASTAITRDLGLSVVLSTPTPAELRSIVLSRPFQGRVLRDWLKEFRANDRSRMMQAIQQGMLQGDTPTQIGQRVFGTKAAKGMDGTRAISRRGAQALADTATAAIANNAREAFYKANARLIDEELIVATLDARTTPYCRSVDGQRHEVGKGPKFPAHIRCRTLRVPVFDGEALQGERPANAATEKALAGLRGDARKKRIRELVGQVPAGTTYQNWLGTQSAAFQDSVLGPRRGRLFRAGNLPLDKFVDRSGRQYTLEQLEHREPEAFRRAGL